LISESDRAEILAALSCVDYVTVYEELTAENLIREVRPQVHCKGTDYRPESVPEKEVVLASGGRVAIVGDPKEHASRDLVRLILERFSPPR
jgi:bifunctional ADP-heptose synthase (sugar kinase/adenylyltransferase)